MAYAQVALAQPFSNPLAQLPLTALALVAIFLGLFGAFVTFAPSAEEADFSVRPISRAQANAAASVTRTRSVYSACVS